MIGVPYATIGPSSERHFRCKCRTTSRPPRRCSTTIILCRWRDHWRLAGSPVILRLEAQRLDGRRADLRPLVHPGFHARAEPHGRKEGFMKATSGVVASGVDGQALAARARAVIPSGTSRSTLFVAAGRPHRAQRPRRLAHRRKRRANPGLQQQLLVAGAWTPGFAAHPARSDRGPQRGRRRVRATRPAERSPSPSTCGIAQATNSGGSSSHSAAGSAAAR